MDEVVEKSAKKAALKQYKITFHSGDAKEETADVLIGFNAKLNRYQRNAPTTIDENFLGVLKDAVIHTTVKDEAGNVVPVTIPRFSYTVEPI